MATIKKKVAPKKAAPKKKVVKKYGDGGRSLPNPTTPPDLPEPTVPTYKPYTDYGFNNQPTADSTLYFTQKQRYFQDAEAANRARGNSKEAKNADLAREKASKDRKRQRRKGMPGYDGNGYPNKATAADIMRNGGKVTTKKVNKMAIAKKKTAPAKKKAIPVKGAWVPPWAKKAVEEKKTGEKYASKAAMAKHEKGESKKMRMKEGEIPMARAGGVKKYNIGGVALSRAVMNAAETASKNKLKPSKASSVSNIKNNTITKTIPNKVATKVSTGAKTLTTSKSAVKPGPGLSRDTSKNIAKSVPSDKLKAAGMKLKSAGLKMKNQGAMLKAKGTAKPTSGLAGLKEGVKDVAKFLLTPTPGVGSLSRVASKGITKTLGKATSMRKGGKTCSCGKAGCMMCVGKKH